MQHAKSQWKVVFAALFLFPSLSVASPINVTNLKKWKYTSISANTPEALFTGDANGVITLGQSKNGPLASVYIHELSIPTDIKLENEVAAWHRIVFPEKPQVKVNFTNERTIMVNGHLRYAVEFEAETGAKTPSKSALIAIPVDGKLQVLVYESSDPTYAKVIESVRQLYRAIDIKSEVKSETKAKN